MRRFGRLASGAPRARCWPGTTALYALRGRLAAVCSAQDTEPLEPGLGLAVTIAWREGRTLTDAGPAGRGRAPPMEARGAVCRAPLGEARVGSTPVWTRRRLPQAGRFADRLLHFVAALAVPPLRAVRLRVRASPAAGPVGRPGRPPPPRRGSQCRFWGGAGGEPCAAIERYRGMQGRRRLCRTRVAGQGGAGQDGAGRMARRGIGPNGPHSTTR